MKERTISATITLPAEQLVELLASRWWTGTRPWWKSTERHAQRARRRGLSVAAPPPSRPCWRMGG